MITVKLDSNASSPLTEPDTDSDTEEYLGPHHHAPPQRQQGPPPKRQRISPPAPDPAPPQTQDTMGDWDISSDSETSIPGSPSRLDDDDHTHPQVSYCEWEACTAGDLGNMDNLVNHINDKHIDGKVKGYLCEWKTCSRRNMPHASGYALRAHMRSHTREKPFYCLVPGNTSSSPACRSRLTYLIECDRSFTRSDALAKHMRIVHETEALRPSDPVPKTLQAAPNRGNSRLKSANKPVSALDAELSTESPLAQSFTHEDTSPESLAAMFTPEELALSWPDLLRHLAGQLRYMQKENDDLDDKIKELEVLKQEEYIQKELLAEETFRQELASVPFRQAQKEARKARKARDAMANADELAMGRLESEIDV